MDRIKTAYIKGILQIDDFDKEIKHIEFQRNEIEKLKTEQKQYDNLNFTLDDLLILQDKQEIDIFVNTISALENIYNWLVLSKEEEINNYLYEQNYDYNNDDFDI